jgi:hypothetical protein
LNQVVAMFSQYCGEGSGNADLKFTVEPVKIIYPEKRLLVELEETTPDMSSYEMECSVDYINSATGIPASIGKPLEGAEMVQLLQKMQLPATLKDEKTMSVMVPPTRSDVLHECDIMEDVAIAFGYDNIKKTVPNTVTIGKQLPINKLTDLLRLEFASCGYTEVLTLCVSSIPLPLVIDCLQASRLWWRHEINQHRSEISGVGREGGNSLRGTDGRFGFRHSALCSLKDNFDNLRRVNEPPIAVEIANAVTVPTARSRLCPRCPIVHARMDWIGFVVLWPASRSLEMMVVVTIIMIK